jgi:protein-tyrosine phosphatase
MRDKKRLIQRVTVICIGNICRSPMAEALLREGLRQSGTQIEVTSAGLGNQGGQPADPIAIKLMAERGLDIDAHRSAEFLPVDGVESDLIMVMTTQMRHFIEERWPLFQGRVYRLGHWGKFDVDDPYKHGERAFRKALKSIDTGVTRWLERITA